MCIILSVAKALEFGEGLRPIAGLSVTTRTVYPELV
jgi:hypothetical protein